MTQKVSLTSQRCQEEGLTELAFGSGVEGLEGMWAIVKSRDT